MDYGHELQLEGRGTQSNEWQYLRCSEACYRSRSDSDEMRGWDEFDERRSRIVEHGTLVKICLLHRRIDMLASVDLLRVSISLDVVHDTEGHEKEGHEEVGSEKPKGGRHVL